MAEGQQGSGEVAVESCGVAEGVSDGEHVDEALRDPGRLEALARSGLSADPDPQLDAFAERVHRWVGAPVALVSLVRPDEQVVPGMAGLPEPWASKRCFPLSHSLCQHVVASGEPLVVPDAREHPLVRDNLAIGELGLVAYAGMPLTDETGHVLGALCAIDSEPWRWTTTQLDMLRDLAVACSTELRLRLSRHAAAVERRHRDELERQQRRTFDQTTALLAASQGFTDTVTVDDVRERISELVTTYLRPSYVGLALLDGHNRLHRTGETRTSGVEDTGPWQPYPLDTATPTATAVRERRIVAYPDRAAFDADHPEPARQLFRDLGLHAVVAVPLPHAGGPLGALALGWDSPRHLAPADLLTITTFAGYTAQALDRARRLHHRDSVAHRLQLAMLTTLPDIPGLVMSARYQPADSRDDVGGDWYDAAPLPDPDHPDGQLLAVSVGDVIGHDLDAATVMGQARSMLRQAAWDHPGEPPSRTLCAFELAAAGLGLRAVGTALLGHLRRSPDGRWSLAWTNAGHPPPILLSPDGSITTLDGHDILFGFPPPPSRSAWPRHDQHRDLDPGSTLFLYTDGLVERRGSDIGTGTERLRHLLDTNRERPPQELVDLAIDVLAPDVPDDVVAFAIRLSADDASGGTAPAAGSPTSFGRRAASAHRDPVREAG